MKRFLSLLLVCSLVIFGCSKKEETENLKQFLSDYQDVTCGLISMYAEYESLLYNESFTTKYSEKYALNLIGAQVSNTMDVEGIDKKIELLNSNQFSSNFPESLRLLEVSSSYLKQYFSTLKTLSTAIEAGVNLTNLEAFSDSLAKINDSVVNEADALISTEGYDEDELMFSRYPYTFCSSQYGYSDTNPITGEIKQNVKFYGSASTTISSKSNSEDSFTYPDGTTVEVNYCEYDESVYGVDYIDPNYAGAYKLLKDTYIRKAPIDRDCNILVEVPAGSFFYVSSSTEGASNGKDGFIWYKVGYIDENGKTYNGWIISDYLWKQ